MWSTRGWQSMCPDRKVIFSDGNWGGLIYKWKSPHLVVFCNGKVQKIIFNLRNKQHISVFGMIGIFFSCCTLEFWWVLAQNHPRAAAISVAKAVAAMASLISIKWVCAKLGYTWAYPTPWPWNHMNIIEHITFPVHNFQVPKPSRWIAGFWNSWNQW